MWLTHHVYEDLFLNSVTEIQYLSSLFSEGIYTGTSSQFVGQQFVPHLVDHQLRRLSYCEHTYHSIFLP